MQAQWQGGGTGTGGKGGNQRGAGSTPEPQWRLSGKQRHQARQNHHTVHNGDGEHQRDKGRHGGQQTHILSRHQFGQQCQNPQRSQAHNPVHDAHHQRQQLIQQAQYARFVGGFAFCRFMGDDGNAKNHGKHHQWQHFAIGHRRKRIEK